MNELQSRVDLLDQAVDRLGKDVKDVNNNLKEVKDELCSWFDRLDNSVQELKLANVKLQEHMTARDQLEEAIKEDLKETKQFHSKIFLALTGGCISLIIWLIQDLFSK